MSNSARTVLPLRRAQPATAPLRVVSPPTSAAPALPDTPPAPDGISWLPAEHVLLLAVPMPAMSAAQRRASAAFAVEEFIAQPLEDVHVVLGPELAKGIWLVAVAGNELMQAHRPAQGSSLRLLPDTLALPVPSTGCAIWAGATRVLVRLSDGTGFATTPEALPTFWAAAGSPAITLLGGTLPEGLTATANTPLPLGPDVSLERFSLLSGRHVPKGQSIPRGLMTLAALLGFAVFGHLSLQIVDVAALGRIAAEREDALRSTLNQPPGADIDTAVAQALAVKNPQETGGFLPLMAQAFAAMAPETGRVTLQDLRYAAAEHSAIMTVEAPDLATLQGLENAFAEAGLRVSAGAATTGNGAAKVQMTVQPGKAP